jgi:transmembrane sensor
MKPTNSLDPETALEELAAGWIVEREEGFSLGRAEAFAEWCSSDPRHAEAVARVESTLALLNEMPAVRAPLEARVAHEARPKLAAVVIAPILPLNPWRWAAGLAAALVIGAAGWWLVPSHVPAAQNYAADAAAPERLALADGSVVDLNANSRLQVRFTKGERQLTLAAGEAHFQVAHNAARPFIVTANGVSVRAVGTAFNVRLIGDKVDVLVTEGKVEVDRQGTTSLFSRKVTVVPQLSAGERTQITPSIGSAPHIEEVAPATVHEILSWQDRMTSFADVPLSEMVVRINRCNATQLVIADPTLAERKIGGVIDLNQVNAFVHLLEREGDIIAERRGNGEIVLRHKP